MFSCLWCRWTVLERMGWGGGGGGGQKHLRIRDVNNKISWSSVSDQFQQIIFKRDSSKQWGQRVFLSLFPQLPVSDKWKAPSACGLQMALWMEEKKEQKKQQEKKGIFTPVSPSCLYQQEKQPLIKTLVPIKRQPIRLFWPLICLCNHD